MTMLSWPAWGTTASLSVTDPAALHAAHRIARQVLVRAEKSADLRNPHAEIHKPVRAAGRQVRIGRPLASMIGAALDAARTTGGLADPTVGNAVVLAEAGTRCSRGVPQRAPWLPVCSEAVPAVTRPAIGWQSVDLVGRYVTTPPGVLLDLTAIGRAVTAQHCADLIGQRLGVGVMVGLGGDVATSGPTPVDGWQVPQRIGPLGPGAGLASVTRPVIDPRTGRVASRVWASVSVLRARAEGGVAAAKALAVAAAVTGPAAPLWLDDRGVPGAARLLVPAESILIPNRPALATAPGTPSSTLRAAG